MLREPMACALPKVFCRNILPTIGGNKAKLVVITQNRDSAAHESNRVAVIFSI